jgi:UTP--glucose-1-phosphate uridylyltransferase
VLLGDVLVPDNQLLRRMREVSAQYDNASVIAVIDVPREEVSRFGVIDGSLVAGSAQDGTAIWHIDALVEKPPVEEAPSTLAVFGRYLLSPEVMRILAHTGPGAGGEIQLTDALVELLATEDLYAVLVRADEGFDCGTVADWLSTNVRLAARDAELLPALTAAYGRISE